MNAKLQKSFNSFNVICVLIGSVCLEEYVRETGEGKSRLGDRNKVYRRQTPMSSNSFNIIYVLIFSGCLEEHIGEICIGKNKMKRKGQSIQTTNSNVLQ